MYSFRSGVTKSLSTATSIGLIYQPWTMEVLLTTKHW